MAVIAQLPVQTFSTADVGGILAPEVPSSPLGSALRRVRRARAFGGASTSSLDLLEHAIDSGAGGLSQAALDALCVDDADAHDGPDSADLACTAAQEEADVEGLLLRVRRMRAFLGADKADAFAADIMSRAPMSSEKSLGVGLDREQDMLTGTDSTRTSPHGGLSQAALDALSTTDGSILQADVDALSDADGLSQVVLDSLSVHYEAPDESFKTDDAGKELSSPGNDEALVRIRRARAFQGAEAVVALIEDIRANHESEKNHVLPTLLSPTCVGKTQQQFDMLCAKSPERCDLSPSSPVHQIASPQRKRRSLLCATSSPASSPAQSAA